MAKIISKYRFNYSFLFWFIFLTLTFIFFPGNNSFASNQVVLEWTPNSESDLAGYMVFCREEDQSYDYANSSWEGVENHCTIYDLDETKTYCFVARAYDTEGFESGDSDEVCHIPTVMPDNQPPMAEVTIEAEDMSIKTTGGPTTGGWNIWSNGNIADDVNFSMEGTYTLEVTAKGNFAGGAWPIMEVWIDQTVVETFTVDSSSWAVYTIEVYVTSGTHEVAVAFTNDYYIPPQDRNLYVDKVTITEAGGNLSPKASIFADGTGGIAPLSVYFDGSGSYDPDGTVSSYNWDFGDGTKDYEMTVNHTFDDPGLYTVTLTVTDDQGATGSDTIQIAANSGSGAELEIEAEDMSIKTTGGPTTGGWNIWSNGNIADDVNFSMEGTYTLEVTAKGNFAGGAWPIMEVWIDQTVVETFTVDSSSWAVYTIEVYVTSGTHEVAVAFTNDYYKPPQDRNLYVDKVTIK